jgi:cell division protein FtsL
MIEVITERFIHTNILARQRVKQKTPDSLACGVVAICLGIALVLCFLLFFWIRIYILQTGYQISGARALQERVTQENDALRVERSALMTSSRIENIARNELGMVTPKTKQVIVLEW